MKKSRPKAIGRKRHERIANGGSEVDVFRKVRIRADGYCELTRQYIYEPKSWCFAHILPKGMYPEYRLEPNNIIYVASIDLHHLVDRLTRGNKLEIKEKIESGEAIQFIRELYYAYNAERPHPFEEKFEKMDRKIYDIE